MLFTEEQLTFFESTLKSRGATNITSTNSDKLLTYDFIIPSLFAFRIELIKDNIWLKLPNIFILANGQSALPHVGNNGLICITDHQGELFDGSEVEQLFEYTIDEAIKVITLAKNDISELYEEIEGYIETTIINNYKVTLSSNPDFAKNLYAVTEVKRGKLFIKEIRESNNELDLPNHGTYRKVITIKLPSILNFIIPEIGGKFDKNWWSQQKNKLSASQINQLHTDKTHKIILLEIPYKNYKTYMVICESNSSNILTCTLDFYTIQRCWKEYIVSRTGITNSSTNDKVVVIAGCGSVGSKVADLLIELPIKKLILVDNDNMSPDNLMRHQLGVQDINFKKVHAIKARINRDMPFIEVEACAENIQSWIKEQSDDTLSQIDSLVLTTGHIPTELAISEYFYYKDFNIHIISGWVEAYGLGGQVFSFLNNSKGCLRCLYSDNNSNIEQSQSRLFNNNGQVLSQNVTGCAGAFIPYSGLHAMKTALLISELIVSPRYGLYTWVNLDSNPSEYNLDTTDYFIETQKNGGQQFTFINQYKIAGCECCSS